MVAVPITAIVRLDEELTALCRHGGALRLVLGEQLERLAAAGGHHELGFSSIEAYALERLERSARWVQGARALARRLARCPCCAPRSRAAG